MLDLCHKLPKLASFVHISTAYAYCHLPETREQLYPMRIKPDEFMALVNSLDANSLNCVTRSLLEDRPNNYVFTKALAEHYIAENHGNIRVAILRPSIITPTCREPKPGWIDSINGPAGACMVGALGIARTMRMQPSYVADFIPVDLVANAAIVAAWHLATDYGHCQPSSGVNNGDEQPASQQLNGDASSTRTAKLLSLPSDSDNVLRIFNVTSSSQHPITWGKFLGLGRCLALENPPLKSIRPPAEIVKNCAPSVIAHKCTQIFSELLFAFMVDLLLLLLGYKRV